MAEENNKTEEQSPATLQHTALRKVTFEGLTDIPFTHLISTPLKACVAAQNESHQTTIAALQEMGIFSDESNKKTAAFIDFEFVKDGKRQKIVVPLITLVPISFFQINSVDISFKASIKSSSSWSTSPSLDLELKEKKEEKKKEEKDKGNKKDEADGGNKKAQASASTSDSVSTKSAQEEKEKKSEEEKKSEDEKKKDKDEDSSWWKAALKYGREAFDIYKEYQKSKEAKDAESKTDYSNKKDSKVTQESKYSIETTVDFKIQAIPADMPGGLAKVIETLNNAVAVFDPSGELRITGDVFTPGARVLVEYLNEDGILAPDEIKCSPMTEVQSQKVETGIYFTFEKAGSYTVKAGKKERTIIVK